MEYHDPRPVVTIVAWTLGVLLLASGCSSGPAEPATGADATTARGGDRTTKTGDDSGNAEKARTGAEVQEEGPSADEEPGEPMLSDLVNKRGKRRQIGVLEPPDGEWLVDEEGREYFVQEIPKLEGQYRWIDDDTIRTRYGLVYKLVGHDDDTFYVKIFKTEPVEATKAEHSEEDLAAAAATYEVEVPFRDVAILEPFGDGVPDHRRWRNGFEIADMNGDGELDIVHSPPRGMTQPPVIYLGDGKGGWKPLEARFPSAPYFYGDAAVADFDRDGHLDVALGMHGKGALVLVSDGTGGFERWDEGIEVQEPGSDRIVSSSRAIEAVDWDGDGWMDLLLFAEGPVGFEHVGRRKSYGKILYRNLGDGTWERQLGEGGKRKIFGDDLVLADVDGDGLVDFVTGTSVQNVDELLNIHTRDHSWRPTPLPGVRPAAYVTAVGVADFDSDGAVDVALGYGSHEYGIRRGGVDVLFNRGEGEWERLPLFATEERIGVTAMGTGDVDGDGDSDLVATTHDSRVLLFLGDGAGGFVRDDVEERSEPVPGCRGFHVALADLDGVEGDEIVASFSGDQCPGTGSIEVWRVESGRGG